MIKIDNPTPGGPAAEFRTLAGADVRALLENAERLLAKLNLPRDDINERMLRNYITLKAVDNPERDGRKGHFGYRHLLQFVVVRRLLDAKWSLADIALFTRAAPLDELEAALTGAKPTSTPAELYMRSQSSSDYARSYAFDPDAAALRRHIPTSRGTVGLVDIIHELRKTAHDQEAMIHRAMSALMDDHRRATQRLIDDQTRRLEQVVDQHRTHTAEMLARLERAVAALETRDREMSRLLNNHQQGEQP